MSKIHRSRVDSIDDVELELVRAGKMTTNKGSDYVNNKELYQEFVAYHKRKMDALAKGETIPPLTDTIGKAIIQIATRRCNSRMYAGYTNNWKEEMISNAIMVASCNGHGFDPSKSENPFAYLTQICDNAIKEQLKKEKREVYIRYKQFDEHRGYLAEDDGEGDTSGFALNELDDAYSDRLKYIADFEARNFNKKKKVDKENDDLQLTFGEEDEQTGDEA